MPISPTYPGVYIQELDSGVRTVAGVPTSIAAFVGRTKKGGVGEPTPCFNMGEFNRRFGGLWSDSNVSYAVDDFFANGGGQCLIVRLFEQDGGDGYAGLTVGTLILRAKSPGAWGNSLSGKISHPDVADPEGAAAAAKKYGLTVNDIFDLEIVDTATDTREVLRTLSMRSDAGQRRFDRILAAQSNLVEAPPAPTFSNSRPADAATGTATGGDDGTTLADATYQGDPALKTGMQALRKADIFNLLCIPPDTREATLPKAVRETAAALCAERRALYIVDPPNEWDANPDTAATTAKNAQLDATDQVLPLTNARNAALYFPRLLKRDPLRGGQIDAFAPCGAVAGVISRTDVNRGVFKAPAGLAATLSNTQGLTVKLTDQENGLLNPIGVNCLRSFQNIGRVVWGARTLAGSDVLSDDYKYVSVRRLALFIEESLFRGTQWVVFEGNDEPLWAQIRLSVGSFMQRLFRQGAFQGASPKEAYFAKCDASTTTQDDINRGIVNIVVGFAPLQPAEFVIISIQQIRSAS
ncbi:phage tail sheath family protein [Ensifer adhaerens]|uniref:Phage tail sheath subtilisin-like domain-containing protein n=1 Tax=Ensifer adhaerens TaxID=106592 RepID=A0A9Q8YEE6_ENSAD|nr:phage tail sheath C-terminal domain-containing protein [Ensifer adhaerens]USJ27138.1 phage tail sheath subtilisin-like domain-containing protein [Ensifer adhaerens]